METPETASVIKKKSGNAIKESVGERIFYFFNYLLFILMGVVTLFPFFESHSEIIKQ